MSDELLKRFHISGLNVRAEAFSLFDAEYKHSRPPYDSYDEYINDLLDVLTLKMMVKEVIIDEDVAQKAIEELRMYRRNEKLVVNQTNRNAIVFNNINIETVDGSGVQKVTSQFNHHCNQLLKGLKKLPVFQSGQFRLTTVDELNTYISPTPLKAIVLGLLRRDTSKVGAFLLEDPTGKLPVHFFMKNGQTVWREWATFDNGIYLVEGYYNGEEDVFGVSSIGLSPPTPFMNLSGEPSANTNSSMCVVVSDIHLDNSTSFEGIKFLLNGYNQIDQVPEVFVLIGDFLSQYSEKSELKHYMSKLIRLIGTFTRIANNSRFVFLPGPNDFGKTKPDNFAHKPFTDEHFPVSTDKIKSFHLASNPFYMQADGKCICFMSANFFEQSCKNVIQSGAFDIQESSSSQAKSSLMKQNNVDSYMNSVGRLIVSNGHLAAGMNRHFVNSLSLLPQIPDAILISDSSLDQFRQKTLYDSVQFATSSSFTNNKLQFLCYYVQDNHFEESEVSI